MDAKLSKRIGKKVSNVKLTLYYHASVTFEEIGVINPDGLGATVSGMAGVYSLDWVTEDEAKVVGKLIKMFFLAKLCKCLLHSVSEAERADSIEAPDCPYQLQPGVKGNKQLTQH